MESEFCEIDFTTATPWENLNARLEEIFYSWKLYQSPDGNNSQNDESFICELGVWNVSHKTLDFDGKVINISYYHKPSIHNGGIKIDGRTESVSSASEEKTDNAFPTHLHPMEINCLSKHLNKSGNDVKIAKLIRLFDLNDFVLMASDNQSLFSTEASVKLLLSSFCISAFNTRCFLPIFVQVFQTWQNCFVGIQVDEEGFRFDYQMIHLGKIPSKFNYFSGILDLFKSKTSPTHSNIIWASVKLSYSLSNFTNFAWPRFKRPLKTDENSEEPVQLLSFDLPFGAASEPVSEIQLHATWPQIYENMVLDNEHHSDFDPENALNWVLQVFAKKSYHLLGKHLLKSLQQCQSSLVINDLISDLLKRRNFNDLNVPVPSNILFSRIIAGGPGSNGNETKISKRFLPEEILVSILYYLFPDADSTNSHPYSLNKLNEDNKEDILLKGMKTCGEDELPWRLGVIICIILYSYGPHAAAQFWYEFTQELRFRWEKNLRILGVQKGSPNHKTSLINQKLQMLNCCIGKKMKREGVAPTSDGSDNQICPISAAPRKFDSDEEEFFDCQSEHKEQKEDNFKVARVSAWDQPGGRLRKFNNLRLIETGNYMYIPITQEMTPKTEDQLEDDAVVLMKLGSDSQGSKLRARMMCSSLYSDMESFKAANPGAVLEDFIRWYSPRDWMESPDEIDKFNQKKGKLSNRMLLPGNMWKEVWDTSFPVPAYRQKCLFDEVKESEKVLHFFESCKTIGDVFSLLLPTLIHAGLHTLLNNETVSMLRTYSPSIDEKINMLVQKSIGITRNITVDMSQNKAVIDEISEIETIVSQYKSIEFKLFPRDVLNEDEERNLLLELVIDQKPIVVPKASKSRLGKRIIFLFSKENKDQSVGGQNNDKKKEDGTFIVSATNDFFHSAAASFNNSISHQQTDQWRTITCPPYQKEFVLHLNTTLPSASSRNSSHSLTAHICSEEIFIASYIGRDLIFV